MTEADKRKKEGGKKNYPALEMMPGKK